MDDFTKMVDFYFANLVKLLHERDQVLNSKIVCLASLSAIDEKIEINRKNAVKASKSLIYK